jgi:hypothetical protein
MTPRQLLKRDRILPREQNSRIILPALKLIQKRNLLLVSPIDTYLCVGRHHIRQYCASVTRLTVLFVVHV